MDTLTAWALFIAGFTDTAFARRMATCSRTGALEAVRCRGAARPGPGAGADGAPACRRCRPRSALEAFATASRMGEPLYTSLGYRPLGSILIFEPAKE